MLETEPQHWWFFTFGVNHTFEGESMHLRYVKLWGTQQGTYGRMCRLFQDRWAYQYRAEEVDLAHLAEFDVTGRAA